MFALASQPHSCIITKSYHLLLRVFLSHGFKFLSGMQSLSLQMVFKNVLITHYSSPETSCQVRCTGLQQNLCYVVGTTTTDKQSILYK